MLLVAAAVGAACFAPPAPPAAASPRSLAELQKEARQVRSQMERLEAEMQVVTQKWEAARQRLDEVNLRLIEARRQLDRSRTALDEQRRLVSNRMVTMYKTGEYTWLDIMADSSSLADAETVLDFLRKISQLDRHEETELQRLAGEARRLERAVEDERRQAVAAQTEIDAQRAAMDQKIAERAVLLKDVVAQIKKILSAPELLAGVSQETGHADDRGQRGRGHGLGDGRGRSLVQHCLLQPVEHDPVDARRDDL